MTPKFLFKRLETFDYIRLRWLGYQLEFFVNGYTVPFEAQKCDRVWRVHFWRFQAWIQRIWSDEEVKAARARE